MKRKHIAKRWLRRLAFVAAAPVMLFLTLALIVYLPPVQDWLVGVVQQRLSLATGLDVSVRRVRLAWPLDLAVHRLSVVQQGDTLVAADALRLDVSLWPLLSGRADIEGFSLHGAQVDSRDFISNTYVRGRIGRLEVAAHGVEWADGRVHVDHAHLSDARLWVALSDTAAPDTSQSSSAWRIEAGSVTIERTRVNLSMPGDSMRLGAGIGYARLAEGLFDTQTTTCAARRFELTGADVTYALRPGRSGAPLANTAFQHADSLLWSGHRPASAGLDANYIALTGVALRVDTLFFEPPGTLRAGLALLTLRERSGIELSGLRGQLAMTPTRLTLTDAQLRLPQSAVRAELQADLSALATGGGGRMMAQIDGQLAAADVRTLLRATAGDSLAALWPDRELTLRATAAGNVDRLSVGTLEATLDGALRLTGSAAGRRLLEPDRSLTARVEIAASDLTFVQQLLPAESRGGFALPCPLLLGGTLGWSAQGATADLALRAPGGNMSLGGHFDPEAQTYRAQLRADRFPLGQFLPGEQVGAFTGSVETVGAGFDPFDPASHMQAHIAIDSLRYAGWQLGRVEADAKLERCELAVNLAADNDVTTSRVDLRATMGQETTARLQAAIDQVDLRRLGVTADTLALGGDVDVTLRAARDLSAYAAEGALRHVRFETAERSILAKDLTFALSGAPDTTWAQLQAGDLQLSLGTCGSVDTLMRDMASFATVLQGQMDEKRIDQHELKDVVPRLDFTLDAGRDNPLGRVLQTQGVTYSHLRLRLKTDPRYGIGGLLRFGTFERGGLRLDTVNVLLRQDSEGLKMDGRLRNYRRNNPYRFEATVSTFFLNTAVGAQLLYTDAEGQKGIDVGLRADLAPSGINLSVFPEAPVIAYRHFAVNDSNYVFLGRDRSLRADLRLEADDGTGLYLYGEPVDSTNDMTLSLANVNLNELSDVLPFLPRLGGKLNGDLHLTAGREQLSAVGMFTADALAFEGVPLGDIGLEATYMPQPGGEHLVSAFVSADEQQVMECEGVYSDATGFAGTARLTGFPLQMANGFLAGTDIALRGTASGELAISDSLATPLFDGTLAFDSAHLYSDAYGFDFRLDDEPLAVERSRLLFDAFGLHSVKQPDNPLRISGAVDMTDFSRIGLNLDLRAQNFEVVNTKRTLSSLLFGKVYANFQAMVRGTVDNMFIRGDLDVLDRTDMTYILKDSPLTVEDRLGDLVQFVDFADTLSVAAAPSTSVGGFDMMLGISVSDAARFRCNLSEDGENYVNLEGGGDLTMRITQQGDFRLTGRFTAGSGEMKYSLPIIPLKTFTITPGSYVNFTGDVANPTLSLAATERVRATVTENDQPRTVAFDVGVALSQTLSNMGLEFTIEAPEDLSMQNQLASMTTAQRSKAAVAMLATGMYVTDDFSGMGSGGGFKASNALNAFLQSEIQNIAGSALKTIDVTVGMESSTSSTGTETTDYSFQFAKRFWNSRVSVIVGGKVSTGEDAQNSAASFIDNITLEYRLDNSASRYVKVFYDRSTHDPLEGELTTTGAGLVLRRKTNRLGELFIFRNKKKQTPEAKEEETDEKK